MNYDKIMKNLTFTFFFLLIFSGCSGQQATEETKEAPYIFKAGDRSGIGKWYLGREIAHVMGYQGMSWLERPEREAEEETRKLLINLDIQDDDVIADIGAGSGYHVFKMARMAPHGTIYAVDIQDEMLTEMRRIKAADNHKNVEIVKGTIKDVNLPRNTVDKVLMVDVYHEFSFPVEMIESIKKSLKPEGEIYLIEYRGEDPTVPIKRLHKMTESQAVKEMNAAGLRLKENINNLPWQHCMVFVLDE